jgi:methylenetetrahydrofolate dehydrogenase (NADP+)/methenyltetrahydrofolate cyclohydrolase
MALLDGKLISTRSKLNLASESEAFLLEYKRKPHLAALLVGEDPASEVYVSSKIRSCAEVGFTSTLVRYPSDISEESVLNLIVEWNQNPEIDGILVQVPLPHHIHEEKVTDTISPSKDVDGFHPNNLGRMMKNLPSFISATPLGILKLLEAYSIPTQGKHCVVLGRSSNVGSPISILMARSGYPGNCTVTLCHSKTQNLQSLLKEADILIAAIGKPEFVHGDMLKTGVVVVDVGINRILDPSKKSGSRIVGDVHFESANAIASYISPVPGGVGLMTIIGLLENTLLAAKKTIYPQ